MCSLWVLSRNGGDLRGWIEWGALFSHKAISETTNHFVGSAEVQRALSSQPSMCTSFGIFFMIVDCVNQGKSKSEHL